VDVLSEGNKGKTPVHMGNNVSEKGSFATRAFRYFQSHGTLHLYVSLDAADPGGIAEFENHCQSNTEFKFPVQIK
jgi:hypothetical protein